MMWDGWNNREWDGTEDLSQILTELQFCLQRDKEGDIQSVTFFQRVYFPVSSGWFEYLVFIYINLVELFTKVSEPKWRE